jgi:hypothetical protein
VGLATAKATGAIHFSLDHFGHTFILSQPTFAFEPLNQHVSRMLV